MELVSLPIVLWKNTTPTDEDARMISVLPRFCQGHSGITLVHTELVYPSSSSSSSSSSTLLASTQILLFLEMLKFSEMIFSQRKKKKIS
jgi:hypothetical protein